MDINTLIEELEDATKTDIELAHHKYHMGYAELVFQAIEDALKFLKKQKEAISHSNKIERCAKCGKCDT